MHPYRITIQNALYALALLLALFLRLLNLGAAPLSEAEATHALSALGVVNPQNAVLAGYSAEGNLSQPGYTALTAAAFALFGSGNFQARLWPALAGALLVLLPLCFRGELGSRAALIMAFGLAVDPGLVIVSRQAGGPMLALALTLLALGLWHIRRPLFAGLLGGCALICGSTFLQGITGLALAWIAWRLIRRRRAFSEEPLSEPLPPSAWRTALIAAAAAGLIGGAISALHTQNLAAFFAAIPAYLGGWAAPVTTQPVVVLAALLLFALFILTFAAVYVVRWLIRRSRDEAEGPFILLLPLLWAGLNVLLVLLYPARQTADLVWSVVPLWALAAAGLADYLPEERPDAIAWLQAALVFLLATLFWNTLVATEQIIPTTDLPISALRLAVLVGLVALGALTTGLVALGWNWESSRNGLVWGLTAAFAIYSTGAMWSAAQLRPNLPQELWSRPPGPGQVDLFLETLHDLSNRNTGLRDEIEIVSTVDAASLRWALHDFRHTRFAARVSPDEQPAIIIASQDSEMPALASAYRGQDFVWWVRPGWTGALPDELINWLTFRKAALANTYIILWARSDLFPK